MRLKSDKYVLASISIIFIMMITMILSFVLKKNIFNIVSIMILGTGACIYIFINEVKLIYIAIVISLLSTFLSQYISVFSNIPQIFLILMIFRMLYTISVKNKKVKLDKFITIIVVLTLIINTISYILFISRDSSIVLYIWSILKRYSFFIIYMYIYNMNNKEVLFKKLDITFKFIIIVQFFFTIIQFINGVNYDNVTGLFGPYSTGEYSHFILVLLAINISYDESEKNKYFNTFLFISIIIYAVIAEVKMLFFVLPLLLILNAVVDRKFKSIAVLVITFIVLGIGGSIYSNIYTQNNLLDKNFINEYLTGDYGEVGINRFNFMEQLKSNVFNNGDQVLIGMGVGAAHPSAKTSILQGPIYKEHESLKIDWFSLPYLIVESGIIGTALYLSIYIYLLIKYFIVAMRTKEKSIFFIVVLSIISIIYNSSLIGSIRIIMFTWAYISLFYNYKTIK